MKKLLEKVLYFIQMTVLILVYIIVGYLLYPIYLDLKIENEIVAILLLIFYVIMGLYLLFWIWYDIVDKRTNKKEDYEMQDKLQEIIDKNIEELKEMEGKKDEQN